MTKFEKQIIEAREEHNGSWKCVSPHLGESVRTSLITKLAVSCR